MVKFVALLSGPTLGEARVVALTSSPVAVAIAEGEARLGFTIPKPGDSILDIERAGTAGDEGQPKRSKGAVGK